MSGLRMTQGERLSATVSVKVLTHSRCLRCRCFHLTRWVWSVLAYMPRTLLRDRCRNDAVNEVPRLILTERRQVYTPSSYDLTALQTSTVAGLMASSATSAEGRTPYGVHTCRPYSLNTQYSVVIPSPGLKSPVNPRPGLRQHPKNSRSRSRSC